MLRASALIAALLVLASAAGRVDADRPGHIAFRHYTSDDGLSALDLVVGVQDREGFIWAASPNGLFRYDGVRFQRFSVEDGLPSMLVTDMAVAPDGVLWGSTSRGLFYRSGDRFVAVGSEVLPLDGMHMLAFDAAGRTWITTNQGPFRVIGATVVERAPGWPGGDSFGILVDPDGTMLVGHGSRLVRRAEGSTVFDDVGHDFVETITNIARDGAGRLWLRAGEHLWMQPRAGAPFVDRSTAYLGAPPGADGLRLARSAMGTLLIPTSVGLIEVNGDDAHFMKTDLPDDARSIKAAWVDREGSLWLASLGLHHELGQGLWRTVSTLDGLPTNSVWSITGLRDGRVAVGTDAGVVILGGERPDTLPAPSVISSVEQPAGILWIATAYKIHNPLNVIQNNIAPLEEYAQELSAAILECRDLIADRAQIDALWQRRDLDYILADATKAFAITKTAIKRVSDIHAELKAFLRKQPLEREPADLADVVRSTATMMQRALPDIEFRFELGPLPLVLVHRGRINQTVTNLLQNAADSMKQKGRITIHATSNDREIQIRVADTGPGVPQQLRSKIFEPFFTTKDVGQGLGLGLSICREIIVAHGGSLELDDSYSQGACFVISLPCAPAAATSAA